MDKKAKSKIYQWYEQRRLVVPAFQAFCLVYRLDKEDYVSQLIASLESQDSNIDQIYKDMQTIVNKQQCQIIRHKKYNQNGIPMDLRRETNVDFLDNRILLVLPERPIVFRALQREKLAPYLKLKILKAEAPVVTPAEEQELVIAPATVYIKQDDYPVSMEEVIKTSSLLYQIVDVAEEADYVLQMKKSRSKTKKVVTWKEVSELAAELHEPTYKI